MLDALKNITGGRGKQAQKQSDDLEQLIASAREERSALSAMLTAVTARSAKLAPLGKSLLEVTEKAAGVSIDTVLSISENIVSSPIPYAYAARDAVASAPVPVQGGQIQVGIQVQVVYFIK